MKYRVTMIIEESADNGRTWAKSEHCQEVALATPFDCYGYAADYMNFAADHLDSPAS